MLNGRCNHVMMEVCRVGFLVLCVLEFESLKECGEIQRFISRNCLLLRMFLLSYEINQRFRPSRERITGTSFGTICRE